MWKFRGVLNLAAGTASALLVCALARPADAANERAVGPLSRPPDLSMYVCEYNLKEAPLDAKVVNPFAKVDPSAIRTCPLTSGTAPGEICYCGSYWGWVTQSPRYAPVKPVGP